MPCPDPDCCGPDEVPNVELFDRPPCFADSACWTWENPYNTSPPGLYQGSPRFHPFSPLYCRDDGDGQGIDIRLTGEGSTIDELSLGDGNCLIVANPLRRVVQADGNISLTSLPVATYRESQVCESACEVILEGTDGDIETGCAGLITATITNDGCWPMSIAPCFTILGANMSNVGQADEISIYQVQFQVGTNAPQTYDVMAETDTSSGPDDSYEAYSGTICLPCFELARGESITITAQTQLTWQTGQSPTTTRVNWGERCLKVTGTSIVNTETIQQIESV